MNNQSIILWGIVIVLSFIIYTFIMIKLRNRRLCKEYIRKYIEQGYSLPIEIVKGTYKVCEKWRGYIIVLIRIENGKEIGASLDATVPDKMYRRVLKGHVYDFYYDYKEHQLCFNNEKRHAEKSCLTENYMKQNWFPLKTRILEKLNR